MVLNSREPFPYETRVASLSELDAHQQIADTLT